MTLICQLGNIKTRLQLFSLGTISPIDEKLIELKRTENRLPK